MKAKDRRLAELRALVPEVNPSEAHCTAAAQH